MSNIVIEEFVREAGGDEGSQFETKKSVTSS